MAFRQLQCNLKQPGKHVNMFMPIEVRRRNARIADFLNLRVPLILHFRQQESAPRATQKQVLEFAGGPENLLLRPTHSPLPPARVRAARDAEAGSRVRPRIRRPYSKGW